MSLTPALAVAVFFSDASDLAVFSDFPGLRAFSDFATFIDFPGFASFFATTCFDGFSGLAAGFDAFAEISSLGSLRFWLIVFARPLTVPAGALNVIIRVFSPSR